MTKASRFAFYICFLQINLISNCSSPGIPEHKNAILPSKKLPTPRGKTVLVLYQQSILNIPLGMFYRGQRPVSFVNRA